MTEKEPACQQCGKSLVDGKCTNDQCEQASLDALGNMPFGSLDPADLIDPTQIVDYTGTIGVAPNEFGSAAIDDVSVDADPVGAEPDMAQTRMIEDVFFQQIQANFPNDSGSKPATGESDDIKEPEQAESSASGSQSEVNQDAAARFANEDDFTQSVTIQTERSNLAIEEFVPPIRDIKFPSDTISLEQIRNLDSSSIEGDEYHITDKLGEGGYGVVFEADQAALSRPVAIKVLKPKKKKGGSESKGSGQSGSGRSGTGTGELQRRRDQFLHEAKITARLQHPNIVPLYDFGINATGQLFYSMKKVQRRPWSNVLHRPDRLLNIAPSEVDESSERQAISRNIEIFFRVCEAMAYAHSMKVVHRDLKPDNIMIGDYGEVLLIDFGMALDLSRGVREFSAGGTLVYMAPEMAEHFSKQKEIQIAAQKTAQKLGVDKGSIFLDQSNVLGVGRLAKKLIKESRDQGVVELAESLIRLDAEEKQLANQISFTSDIYLLGAMLYQIAVGHPPHYFPLSACKKGAREKFQKELWLALKNGFQQYTQVNDPLRLSLKAIAVQAMRTDPKDRFQTVEELQEAIRGFQQQVQSMELTETGKEALGKAKGREDYQYLLPALESFRGASELWPEGKEARQLRQSAACEYAQRANKRRDYDAGLSILDEYVAEQQQREAPVVEARERLIRGKKISARNRLIAIASSVAAVVLPLSAFIYFSYKTADIRQLAANATQEALEQTQIAETQKAAAAEATKRAREQEALAAKNEMKAENQRRAKEEQEKLAQAAKILAAEQTSVAAEQKRVAAEQARIANEKASLAAEQTKIAAQQRALADQAEKKAEAQTQLAAAQRKIAEEEKRKAAKFELQAALGEYTSNVLTIPLDLRTSKREEAAAKLAALQDSTANAQFKNGWLVKHFSKLLSAGTSIQPAADSSIQAIVAMPGTSEAIAVGDSGGKTKIWKITSAGTLESLPFDIELSGVVDASISADGRQLGLAFDPSSSAGQRPSAAGIITVDLTSGRQISLPKENLNRLSGCRHVTFSDSDPQRLVAVEEIKGSSDLKNRVHVVEYQLTDGRLSETRRQPVAATNRSEDRIERWLASTRWINGEPLTAVIFDSLATQEIDSGNNINVAVLQLQVVDGVNVSDAVTLEGDQDELPTAMLVGQNGALYCGYADGRVQVFDGENPQSTARSLGENLNENEIAVLAEFTSGQLAAASKNGKVWIWDKDRQPLREVDRQQGQLTSLALFNDGSFISGGDSGSISLWQPKEDQGTAILEKASAAEVTCAAIDQSLAAGPVPAAAFGTTSGNVRYFDSKAMQTRGAGQQISDSSTAKFSFKSPYEFFDNAFDDFDSMGIIDDTFVVMKQDGTLVSSQIDDRAERQNFAGAQMRTVRPQGPVDRDYAPLMASVYDRDYFYTNSPFDREQLLLWRATNGQFSSSPVSIQSGSPGEIKRLSMSDDGKWLAIVRLADRKSGQYRVEMMDVAGGQNRLRPAKVSDAYAISDPAFVGFSSDSTKMVFNRHSRGVDRETSVEMWQLTGNQWSANGPAVNVADRKLDLIDWSDSNNQDQFVARFRRRFFLAKAGAESLPQLAPRGTRNVLAAADTNQFYVLTNGALSRSPGIQSEDDFEKMISNKNLTNARDLRVFGDRIVVLDQLGFHLFDSDLRYVTKIANRRTAVSSLSLSNQRLAIVYQNELCRIWNVGGEIPTGIGEVEGVQTVRISPDGRWAACKGADQIRIYDIRSGFDSQKPIRSFPFASGAFHWSGKQQSTLVVATSGELGTDWAELDPSTGKTTKRLDLPTQIAGIKEFKISPVTENFIAIDAGDGISLWATGQGENLTRLTRENHEFNTSPLRDIKSITFSELSTGDVKNVDDVGTRMAILASGAPGEKPVARIYLLARQRQLNATDKAGADAGLDAGLDTKKSAPTYRYRVVEIEEALQSKSTNQQVLTSIDFSGDGKSLLQVRKQSIQALLSAE